MNLWDAKLCLDDNEVFEGDHCPKCASRGFVQIRTWVAPAASGIGKIKKKRRVKQAEKKPVRIKMVKAVKA